MAAAGEVQGGERARIRPAEQGLSHSRLIASPGGISDLFGHGVKCRITAACRRTGF